MAFGKSSSIGEPKKALYGEAVAAEELGKRQAGVAESAKTIAQHAGTIGGLLDQLVKEFKAAQKITQEATQQQRNIAGNVGEHALRLAGVAAGTDDRDLQEAARAFQAQVKPTEDHAAHLQAIDKFMAGGAGTVQKLIEGLHRDPGSLAMANNLSEGMKTSADVLARAGSAAASHAPVL
ncbi:MAG TPA: hypothetical protein VFB59_03570 [Candidatus Saccharimonadales bacterium]|nr:hypothetical protein [Candidatus Saccharimonadales bacterium]